MNASLSFSRNFTRNVLIDISAFLMIYLAPSFAHLTGIPVYMAEPMRIMLILAMMHSSRVNAVILALTLPLFSFLVSGHPESIKMLIITGELLANVLLFYFLIRKNIHPWFAMFSAILVSKFLCYTAYWPLISFSFMVSEATPFFLLIQVITTTIFSFYCMMVFKR